MSNRTGPPGVDLGDEDRRAVLGAALDAEAEPAGARFVPRAVPVRLGARRRGAALLRRRRRRVRLMAVARLGAPLALQHY